MSDIAGAPTDQLTFLLQAGSKNAIRLVSRSKDRRKFRQGTRKTERHVGSRNHNSIRQMKTEKKSILKPLAKILMRISWAGFLVVCLLGSPFLAARSQTDSHKVRQIRIEGNRALSDKNIRGLFSTRTGRTFSPSVFEVDKAILLEEYLSRGYYFAVLDSVTQIPDEKNEGITLTIFITENDRVKLGTFNFTGNKILTVEKILQRLNSNRGEVFYPGKIEADIEEILVQYEKIGHPFARVTTDRIEVRDVDGRLYADVHLLIDEGMPVTIEAIRFQGNSVTKTHVLLRETRIRPPSLYDKKRIDGSVRRLKRLGFLEDVRPPTIYVADSARYGLLYSILEAQANTVNGILGYVPAQTVSDGAENEEKGYFTGFLDLLFRNFLGTGRRIGVQWQKKDQSSQELHLAYLEPWVLNYPLDVDLGFSAVFEGSRDPAVTGPLYIQLHYNTNFSYALNENLKTRIGYIRDVTDLPDKNSVLFDIPYSSGHSFEIGLQYDTRDDIVNPLSGLLYRTSLRYQAKNQVFQIPDSTGTKLVFLSPTDSVRVNEIRKSLRPNQLRMDLEIILPSFFRKQLFFLGFHGALYRSAESVVPISDRFKIGGTNDIRGYREDFFNGTRIAWSNLEYRFILSRKSRLFAFLDTGLIYKKDYTDLTRATVEAKKQYPIGFGFGLRFQTRLGIIGVDYGVNREDPAFSNGKLHVGLTSEF